MTDFTKIPFSCYIIEENKLRKNLSLIKFVAEKSDIEIILAFKAFAMWKTFPIIKEYIKNSTASSVSEAKLSFYEMGTKAHTFTPAITKDNINDFLKYSSHISFNSINQFNSFVPDILNHKEKVSCGIRINPEYSNVTTEIYNPALPGSRFGVLSSQLPETLPDEIEGFHFHALCESTSYDLEEVLKHVEEKFGKYLPKLKWLNMGGGHLITSANYDVEHLIRLLKTFKNKYPNLHIILEPGSAFVWQTGVLKSKVVDLVENKGITTAILDVSFSCHMPDCLEMPYKPIIRGAYQEPVDGKPTYRMGGCSCLSGDFVGDWSFDKPLKIDDTIIFEDMIHYTTVKTTMFNGVHHPSLAILRTNGELEILREYRYEDYKNNMN